MGGVVMMLAGAAVYYRARLQPTVALSSTKAEFVNMTNAGKAALYIRWILEEIGLMQVDPTPIQADNSGAIAITNAHKPTRRTRHVNMRAFIILQWTDNKFINFVQTPTKNQTSNSLSKATDRVKFYEHMDVMMGRQKSHYVDQPTKIIHYISRLGNDPYYKPWDNPLYDMTTSPHHHYVSMVDHPLYFLSREWSHHYVSILDTT